MGGHCTNVKYQNIESIAIKNTPFHISKIFAKGKGLEVKNNSFPIKKVNSNVINT
jgi:hypothetical protein